MKAVLQPCWKHCIISLCTSSLVFALQIAKEEKLLDSHTWRNGLLQSCSLSQSSRIHQNTKSLTLQTDIKGQSTPEDRNSGPATAACITAALGHLRETGTCVWPRGVLYLEKMKIHILPSLRSWIHVHVLLRLKKVQGAWTDVEHLTLAFTKGLEYFPLSQT